VLKVETSNPQPELVLELDLSTGLMLYRLNSDNQRVQLYIELTCFALKQ
jgi:hypothetical protein